MIKFEEILFYFFVTFKIFTKNIFLIHIYHLCTVVRGILVY